MTLTDSFSQRTGQRSCLRWSSAPGRLAGGGCTPLDDRSSTARCSCVDSSTGSTAAASGPYSRSNTFDRAAVPARHLDTAVPLFGGWEGRTCGRPRRIECRMPLMSCSPCSCRGLGCVGRAVCTMGLSPDRKQLATANTRTPNVESAPHRHRKK
jgi:hypothetical protein